MTEVDLRFLQELQRRKEANEGAPPRSSSAGSGGGEPPRGGSLDQRVDRLEQQFSSIDKTLAVMSEQMKHLATHDDVATLTVKVDAKASSAEAATIKGMIEQRALATDLAELKGRVARIPTVPVLTSILVFVSLLFAAATWAVRHLPETWARALQ